MANRTLLLGLGLALLAAMAYGSNVPFARLSAQAGITGPDIVFYRSLAMVVLLGAFVVGTGGSLFVRAESRRSLLGLGLTTSLVALAYLSSVAYIPVGVATVVYYMFPLIILAVAPLVDGSAVTPARIAVFAVAFAGLVLAIGPTFAVLDPRGLALAVTAAMGAAGQFFFASRTMQATGPAVAGFWTQLILVPIALATALATGGPVAPSGLAVAAVPVALTCGLFMLAFGLHMSSARLAPPAVLGLIFCAEPITSIAVAALVLDERLTPGQIAGGLLVLVAVVAAIGLESRRPRTA